MNDFLERLQGHLTPLEAWGSFRSGARTAAVALVLYRRDRTVHVPFVMRRSDLPDHPGQVALPGGMVRAGEEAWAAARREVEEELGIAASELRGLGAGSVVYAAVTNFSVVPFVSWLERPSPRFVHDVRELDGILEVPLERLLAEDAWLEDTETWLGRHFPWQSSIVWGLTARILGDLLPRFRDALPAGGVPAQDLPAAPG